MSWLHASDSLLHLSACGVCTGHIRESWFKKELNNGESKENKKEHEMETRWSFKGEKFVLACFLRKGMNAEDKDVGLAT